MKKFLSYILILIIIAIGFFIPTEGLIQAQEETGTCQSDQNTYINVTEEECTRVTTSLGETNVAWTPSPATPYQECLALGGTTESCKGKAGEPGTAPAPDPAPAPTAAQNNLQRNLPECGVLLSGTLEGCLVKFSYYIFFALPSFILVLSANLFNAMVGIALGTELYKSTFISEGWAVVRDFSNIFFILILLYIALKIILDLGGSEAKKMIVRVIIIALLINFSMFFTKVIIDVSNTLALIFYNKITITNPSYEPTFDSSKTGVVEKDLGGGLAAAFNPNKFIGPDLFKAAETKRIFIGMVGLVPTFATVTTKEGTTTAQFLAIIFTGALVFLFASYAFFIAGISFMARLMELWVLIIFSPFAFMSSSVPLLNGIDYIGWKSWFARLLKVSFMAPIFMFFMYLIVKLVQIPFWKDIEGDNSGFIAKLLFIVIPAGIILTLLLKATEFAKKGSGVVGEKLMAGAKMIGGMATGIALGAATGGAAVLGRATLGRAGAALANSEWAKERERTGKFGGATLRNIGTAAGAGSFDIRGVKIAGKTLGSATGIPLGEAQKGGFEARKKEQIEKRVKRAKELQVGEDEPLKQALNETEKDLQKLLGENAHILETLDKAIEKKRQEVSDAEKKFNAARGTAGEGAARAELTLANGALDYAKRNKKDFREGRGYMVTSPTGATTMLPGTGTNIDALEDKKKEQAQAIKTENVKRNQQYAETQQSVDARTIGYILSGGTYTKPASKEAAHKIIMETKLESGSKGH